MLCPSSSELAIVYRTVVRMSICLPTETSPTMKPSLVSLPSIAPDPVLPFFPSPSSKMNFHPCALV